MPPITILSVSTANKNNLGLVVDQNDPKQLADAIRDSLSRPESGQIYVNNSQQIFLRNHGAQNNAHALAAIFRQSKYYGPRTR